MEKLLKGATALALWSVIGVGCAQPGPELGSLDVAIVATGASGATYHLPDGTALEVVGTTYGDGFSLDGTAQALSFDVPPGDYQVSLFHAAGYTAEWPLTRDLPGGGSEEIIATLLPIDPITVVAGATTEVAIRFLVSTGEVIEFAHGTVQAVVVIDESGRADTLNGSSLDLTCDSSSTGPQIPAPLAARLPLAGDTGLGAEVTVRVTGPWQQVSRIAACADAAVDVALGYGHTGMADLMLESGAAGAGRVCVNDVGVDSVVVVRLERIGGPVTGTFLDLGDRQYRFQTQVHLAVPLRLFDGTTLDLRALVGSHAASATVVTVVEGSPEGAGAPLELFYSATLLGTGSVSFR